MSSEKEERLPGVSPLAAARRISRGALYFGVARLYGERSTCLRAGVGAVAVRDGRIIASGYNGAPAKAHHCLEYGCLLEGGHCIRAVHAEANLIAWSARIGLSLEGTALYSTMRPCLACAKLIANAGITQVHYLEEYAHSDKATEFLYDLGIRVEHHYEP